MTGPIDKTPVVDEGRVLKCFAGTGKRHSVCPPARGNTMIGLPRPTLVGLP